MKKIFFILILFFTITFTNPIARQNVERQGLDIITYLQNTFNIAGILIMIAIITNTFLYYLGIVLSNEKVIASAKMEYSEILISIVIVSLISSSILIFNNQFLIPMLESTDDYFDICIVSNQTPCHILIADYILHEYFIAMINNMLSIGIHNNNIATLASISISQEYVGSQMFNYGFSPFPQMNVLLEYNFMAMDMLVPIVMINRIIAGLLNIIAIDFFKMFFAIGLGLRLFAPARKLGGFLMALSFAFYFFFPLSLILNHMIVINVMGGVNEFNKMDTDTTYFSQMNIPGIDDSGDIFNNTSTNLSYMEKMLDWESLLNESVNFENISLDFNFCKGSIYTNAFSWGEDNPIFDNFNSLKLMIDFGYNVYVVIKDMGRIYLNMLRIGIVTPYLQRGGLADSIAKYFVVTATLPFFSILTTIAFLKSFSEFFGGETTIGGLSQMV